MPTPALGVYVHWPYCTRICPYCDFNVFKNNGDAKDALVDAICTDLSYWAERINKRPLTSLYFGGGTPSLMEPDDVARLITLCDELFGLADQTEITIEANPTDAEISRFNSLAKSGVNRLSLGVQSIDDNALKFLGRTHSADDGKRAFEAARTAFSAVNIDLIYARPGQSTNDWHNELSTVLEWAPDHLSLYQLTIEPGTAFEKQTSAGRWQPAAEALCADHYEITQTLTKAASLPAYEVSNHASTARQSAHNKLYWTYQDYIGVGPGAHGRLTISADQKDRTAIKAFDNPQRYIQQVSQNSHGAESLDPLTPAQQLMERISMGLRLHEGIPLYADDPFYCDPALVDRLSNLVDEGWLLHHCGTLKVSDQGRPLLNRVLYELLG